MKQNKCWSFSWRSCPLCQSIKLFGRLKYCLVRIQLSKQCYWLLLKVPTLKSYWAILRNQDFKPTASNHPSFTHYQQQRLTAIVCECNCRNTMKIFLIASFPGISTGGHSMLDFQNFPSRIKEPSCSSIILTIRLGLVNSKAGCQKLLN